VNINKHTEPTFKTLPIAKRVRYWDKRIAFFKNIKKQSNRKIYARNPKHDLKTRRMLVTTAVIDKAVAKAEMKYCDSDSDLKHKLF